MMLYAAIALLGLGATGGLAYRPPRCSFFYPFEDHELEYLDRADWFFVKLHTHGAPEESHEVLLGEPMRRFHEGRARRAREGPAFRYHYVTAPEVYNLARAAEAGWQGGVAEARDYELTWSGGVPAGSATVSPQLAGSRSD